VPENLDDILQGSANIWFTEDRNLEVTVQIDASCSHYFKRRTSERGDQGGAGKGLSAAYVKSEDYGLEERAAPLEREAARIVS